MPEAQQPQESPLGIEYADTQGTVKPIYLFADSQLLFWKPEGRPLMQTVRAQITKSAPSAAYVGASNGDDPAYYQIFEAAMSEAAISDCRMIPSELGPDDLDFLDYADLILLAGGEVERGWRTFEDNGLKQILVRRYYEGALMMGISAGAVQLGLAGWSAEGPGAGRLLDTFRILPHLVGAHEEENEWAALKVAMREMGEHVRAYGIPFGGGFVYHGDHSIEPLRKPLVEIRVRGRELEQTLILPGAAGDDDEARPPVVN